MLIDGRYLLLEPVGQGGFGRVWRGRDQLLDRHVAVKEVLLPPNLPREAHNELLARTMREARAAARLNHPSVITIHDVAEHDGVPWIVMEFVSGPSLRAEIERYGRLAWQRAAEIGGQIADALAQAHVSGITHRDLKPDNILLSGRRAIVTDFGIARVADASTKLTGTGAVIGTPNYMAPEQFDDRPVGPATDMWAFGATLYATVEGRPPFDGSTLTALIGAVLTRPAPAPQHAGPLAMLIQALLSKDPSLRPDAATVARSLTPYGTSSSPAKVSPPMPAPAPVGVPATTWVPPAAKGFRTQASDGPVTRTAVPGINTSPRARVAPSRRTPVGGVPGTTRSRRPVRSRVIAISATATAAVIAAAVLPLTLGGHHPLTTSLMATLTGPTKGNVYSVAFSPDGKSLATSDGGGHTYLWNTSTNKITATLTDPSHSGVTAVAFSPDGKTLATSDGGGHTYLWNTSTNKITATLTDPGGNITWVTFTADGKTLATSDYNGHAYLWSTATGKVTATLTDPNSDYSVSGVAFTPDGKTLATSDFNGSAPSTGHTYLWSTTTDKITATLTDPSHSGVGVVAFSPDGKTLATPDGSGTYLWNITTKQITGTLTDPSNSTVFSVAFTRDGKTLATGDKNGHTYLWNTTTDKITATLTDPDAGDNGVFSLAFTPDGKTLATGDWNGSTYLWRVAGR